MIRITREFAATPDQLFRAHTDPDLYARWVGPDDMSTKIDHWDARNGGSWRFVDLRDGEEYAFRGCFHTVTPERIVQTFTWEGMPDDVSLETLRFEDLGTGAPGSSPSRCATASRAATRGWPAAWRSASTRATPSSTGCSRPAMVPSEPRDRHRLFAGVFSARVEATAGLGRAGAGDRLGGPRRRGHLVTWFPGLPGDGLRRAAARGTGRGRRPGRRLAGPRRRRPGRARRPGVRRARCSRTGTPAPWPCPRRSTGSTPPTSSCTPGTWPAPPARTTTLDADFCAELLAGMEPIEDLMRQSGQYGPRVPVPADAAAQDRLLGFIGRDPGWSPPA